MLSLTFAATGVLLFLAAGAFWASIYNHLVALKNVCDSGFAQLEIRLKGRNDRILELVESVKDALRHEQETLASVIAAHNQALAGLTLAAQNLGSVVVLHDWATAEGRLASALEQLRMVMEEHPEFKVDQNLAQLAEELTLAENRVAYTRHAYNDWVTDFNTFRQIFPNVYLASFCGFPENRPLLEVADPGKVPRALAV